MEKPTLAFFSTLGQYVYQYIDDEGKVYYTGKGNGDRCWSHVSSKEFSPDHCYIVAKNLEKFESKKDWQSFLLESFLISTQNPDGNSVSGHYKECFIMAKLSEYFGKYQNDQSDPFESLPDWYLHNYDCLRGRITELNINSITTFIKSAARNKIYMMWWHSPLKSKETKVGFEVKMDPGEERTEAIKLLKQWLKSLGYPKTSQDGVDYKIHIMVKSMDEVFELFNKFNS